MYHLIIMCTPIWFTHCDNTTWSTTKTLGFLNQYPNYLNLSLQYIPTMDPLMKLILMGYPVDNVCASNSLGSYHCKVLLKQHSRSHCIFQTKSLGQQKDLLILITHIYLNIWGKAVSLYYYLSCFACNCLLIDIDDLWLYHSLKFRSRYEIF